jgi:hypothetical protein
MNAQQFNDIAIGTPVIVYSFGIHYGRIAGKRPTVTIQGRTFTADDWLKVAITAPDGTTREWNGIYQDVEINAGATDGRCHNAEPGTFNHECGSRRHSSAPAATASCPAFANPASPRAGKPATTRTGRRSSAETKRGCSGPSHEVIEAVGDESEGPPGTG